MLDAALTYVARDWPVFPVHYVKDGACSCGQQCSSPAKHPMTMNGLKAATTDPDRIRRWWTRHPDSNIGLVTGVAFDVFDIDDASGLLDLGLIPQVTDMCGPAVLTGGYGMHCYVKPTGIGNRAKFIAGCDWRGKGGYVLAPPSGHMSGHPYEWLDTLTSDYRAEIRDCPQWLRERLEPPKPVVLPRVRLGATGSGYGRAALEDELLKLAGTPEGHRNHALNVAAFNLGQLVAGGSLDRQEVESALTSAALAAGLSGGETKATIKSGIEDGMKQPR